MKTTLDDNDLMRLLKASWNNSQDEGPAEPLRIEAGRVIDEHIAQALTAVQRRFQDSLEVEMRGAKEAAWAEGHRAGVADGESGFEAGTDRHLSRTANPYKQKEPTP